MAKYIDADRLKAEIERRRLQNRYIDTDGYEQELFEIIDSLQQEQPEIDLEKEFADFLEKENAYVDDNNKISYYNGSSFDHTCDIYPIARHFFNLGKLNTRKEE